MRAALALAVGLALVLPRAPAAAQLYRWSDAQGTVHYTSDRASIPAEYREQATDIGAPTPGPRTAPAGARGIEIPYTGGPLLVSASLNGVPLQLLVDTGADRTLISPRAMAQAGFDPGAGIPVQIRGVTGAAAAMLVSVPRLDLAGVQLGPVGVIVHTPGTPGVDGLLGRDVLDAFTVTVDPPAGRARLVPR